MVKKLFKHEFSAVLRLMLPVECALLGVGLLTRMIMLFENDSMIFRFTAISAWAMMVIAFALSFVLLTVFGIVRYYKNMFSYEGYLTFTLPVSNTQHILVKSATIVLFEVITLFTVFVSFSVAASGNLLVEIFKAAAYGINILLKNVSAGDTAIIVIEIILTLLLAAFFKYFIYYLCITIGQTAKKHRVLWAVVTYFIYQAICWVFATVVQIVMFVAPGPQSWILHIMESIEKNPVGFCQGALCGNIIITALLCCALFFVIRRIMTKKLNLE